jgi:hypothetical protein
MISTSFISLFYGIIQNNSVAIYRDFIITKESIKYLWIIHIKNEKEKKE